MRVVVSGEGTGEPLNRLRTEGTEQFWWLWARVGGGGPWLSRAQSLPAGGSMPDGGGSEEGSRLLSAVRKAAPRLVFCRLRELALAAQSARPQRPQREDTKTVSLGRG